MARQTKRIPRRNQVRRVLSTVHLVAIEAPHLPVIHIALHKIIPLHPVLVRRQIGILKKVRSPRLQLLQPPVIHQPLARQKAHRPVVVLPRNRIRHRTPLAVALNTSVIASHIIQPIRDSRCSPASDAPHAGSPAHGTSRTPHSTPSPDASPRCSSPNGTHRTSAPSAGQSSSAHRTAPTNPYPFST